MRQVALAVVLLSMLGCTLLYGESVLGKQYSAAVIRPAQLAEEGNYPDRDVELFLDMITEAVVTGMNRLYMVPAVEQQQEATPALYPGELAPHLLDCTPVVTEILHRVGEDSDRHIIEATINLVCRLGGSAERFSINVIGFGEQWAPAFQKAADQYERQIGYLFAGEIEPETAVQIESFFNGYITGRLPKKNQVRPGDEFVVYKNRVEESALLTVTHLFPGNEEDYPAAQFALQYAEVPLSVGTELHPRSPQGGLPVTYHLRQGLGSVEAGAELTISRPADSFGLIGGISAGYAWGGFDEFSRVTEEFSGGWISLSAGGMYKFEAGKFRVDGHAKLRSPYWLQATSSLEFGTYFERQSSFVGSSWSFRLGRYQSSRLEIGIAAGLSQRWLLQSQGNRVRSAAYIGPFVTFR